MKESSESNIINLSSYTLNAAETSLLQKGLSFVPVTKFKAFTWIKDLNLFVRKLKWHKFMKNTDQQTCAQLGIECKDLPDVRILADLWEEGARAPGEGPFTSLKLKSKRLPPLSIRTMRTYF